jgi:hypothetical protein
MGLRAPIPIPLIPEALSAFLDPIKSAPWFPGIAEAKQHALATSGRGVGIGAGIYITDGTTAMFPVPVPPGVVYMQVRLMMSGVGSISVDSTNNGTAKTLGTELQGMDAASAAVLMQTSTLPGDMTTSPLKVRSASAWTWTTETVTVTFTSSSTGDTGTIYGIAFDPVWEPQST